MKETTIIFPVDKDRVLLGMKKRGFGVDMRNGFGGKLEGKETFLENAQRELHEEIGVHISQDQFQLKAIIDFMTVDGDNVSLFTISHVFVVPYVENWRESEEMKPQLFPINSLPLDQMREGDKSWIGKIFGIYEGIKRFKVKYDQNFNFLNCDEVT